MNVLLVQQLSWGKRIGHEVACALAAAGNRVSALVHGQEGLEHIARQRDISYVSVHFADPLYDEGAERISEYQVAEIEERYGLESVWRIAYCDRSLIFSFLDSRHFVARKPVSNDYILSVVWKTYRFIRDVVEQVKPAYVFAPSVGSLANYFLYLECRYAGIPFYTIGFSRFGKHFYIGDTLYLGSTRIAARFHELREEPSISPRYEEACRLYASIRRDDPESRPTYASRIRKPGPSFRWALACARDVALFPARVARVLTRGRRVRGIRNIWMPANSRWNAVRTVWVDLRERFIRTNHQGERLTDLRSLVFPYVYFPLHVEPELSLLVFAPQHANQIELCRRIALGLPHGVRLLVKEHPSMVPARPRGFYHDLRGLPNVELADSDLSSHAIATHPQCRASVVVSSTAGFEAAMTGCPVVLLAPVQYSLLPGVTLAESVEEAGRHLWALCTASGRVESVDAEQLRLAYLCAVLENARPLDYQRWRSGRGDVDVRDLVDALQRRVAEGPSGTAGIAAHPVGVSGRT
jgi:hypothetical protein